MTILITEPKKRGKSGKEKDSKEPKQGQQQRAVAATEAEEVEPPSPAPSSQSSSSKKGGPSGGGSSARKSKKEKDAAAAALLTSVSASSTKEGLLSSEQPSEGPAAATLGLDSQKKMVLPLGGADEIPGCIGKDVKIQIGDKLLVIYPKGDHNVTYDAKVSQIVDCYNFFLSFSYSSRKFVHVFFNIRVYFRYWTPTKNLVPSLYTIWAGIFDTMNGFLGEGLQKI